MRSASYNEFGKPSDVLSVGDTTIPEPKSNEIRIKTILAPIHNHDLATVRGQYGYKPELPAIGGSEAVGVIDALGDDVEGFKVGQRVSAANCHETWAEFFIAPAKLVFAVPDELKDEMAAQLIAMPLSALMLLEFLKLQSGQWVIHNAANGAVGKTLAILATGRGIKTINLVRRDEAKDELKALGIENNVSTADDDWKDQVRAIVGNQPIAAAIDSVGGKASGDLLSLLGDGGTIVAFSAQSGDPMAIKSGGLIFKQATVKGFWGTETSVNMDVKNKQRLVNELIERATSGKLQLPVEKIYDLADVAKAVSDDVQSDKNGKILLKP
ncbi:zinc-binding dehydrogenase [Psychrobacter frigidicola]|uniref:zinc-binding dehydrogenase n=1 Tax=Psychrobacter frigidicola TaxID=45611 RepID=UPI00191B1988|nr:zinc-binding dehydrogenase [Psychrobacter frigidicola]